MEKCVVSSRLIHTKKCPHVFMLAFFPSFPQLLLISKQPDALRFQQSSNPVFTCSSSRVLSHLDENSSFLQYFFFFYVFLFILCSHVVLLFRSCDCSDYLAASLLGKWDFPEISTQGSSLCNSLFIRSYLFHIRANTNGFPLSICRIFIVKTRLY